MDDFLHNLRSGKLKQADRGSRSYNDPQYKNAQRRSMMGRNKREMENKESFERLNAIKDVLESLAETQKRMAMAYEARTRAEERKARAMEVLAKNLYQMLNPEAKNLDELFAFQEPTLLTERPGPSASEDRQSEEPVLMVAENEIADEDNAKENETDEETSDNKKLSENDRLNIVQMATELREEGQSWEKIARQIAEQGYPTISGKGTWRGVMVKNLLEKMENEQYNR